MEFAVDGPASGLQGKLVDAFPDLECEAVAHGALRVSSGKPVRIGPLVRFLEEHGLEVGEARKVRPSLVEVFVQVTGIEAAAMKKERSGGGA